MGLEVLEEKKVSWGSGGELAWLLKAIWELVSGWDSGGKRM